MSDEALPLLRAMESPPLDDLLRVREVHMSDYLNCLGCRNRQAVLDILREDHRKMVYLEAVIKALEEYTDEDFAGIHVVHPAEYIRHKFEDGGL